VKKILESTRRGKGVDIQENEISTLHLAQKRRERLMLRCEKVGEGGSLSAFRERGAFFVLLFLSKKGGKRKENL